MRHDGYVDEFLAADILVIGAPMYNSGIPSQLKAWIEHVAAILVYNPDRAFRRIRRSDGWKALLSRCEIGLASRSRRITSRPGIAAFSAATNANDSWREAELVPVMLESM